MCTLFLIVSSLMNFQKLAKIKGTGENSVFGSDHILNGPVFRASAMAGFVTYAGFCGKTTIR